MEKKKVMLAADLIVDHGDKIKDLYEKGANVTKLCTKYGSSRNTMVKVLMKLGFTGPQWAKNKGYGVNTRKTE